MAMNTQSLILVGLVMIAFAGVAWVFLYPILSGERAAERRMESVAKAEPVTRVSRGAQKTKREQVEDTLKELEVRHKKDARIGLSTRITQAGLDISKKNFILISAGLGVLIFLVMMGFNAGLLPSLGFAFVAAFGLPRWGLSFLKKRREAKFLDVFPDAVDVIVRGIKAGLPLLDSLKIITTDAPEPVKSEFHAIVQTQTIGIPLGDACAKLYDRMPLPEANFFGIVISIQQKSGGNLSEALGNLSRVLRDRKKMKAKIQAMKMEAKASGMIIAALPLAVMAIVSITSPNYISLLWTEPMGRMMLAASAGWMMMGVLVMKKMINFDF
jgi:tight adherence protein B